MTATNLMGLKATTIRLLKEHLGSEANVSGASLYTGWDSLQPAYVYLMGLNPGAPPETTGTSILQETSDTKSAWNPLTQENWPSSLQKGIVDILRLIGPHLCSANGDLRDVFWANAIFERSVSAKDLKHPWRAWERCWPVHQYFLSIVRPKLVLCLGNSDSLSAFSMVRQKLENPDDRSYSYLGPAAQGSFRSGKWTQGKFRLPDGTTHRATVVGVAHPSRFHVPSAFSEAIQQPEIRQRLGLGTLSAV